MTREEVLRDNADIFDNIGDYALIRNPSGSLLPYLVFHAASMGWVLIEEHSDVVVEKMLELGVRIVDNAEDVRPLGFKRTYPVWDDEKNKFIELSQEEFDEFLKKQELAKKNRKKK
jgi:hypothetical protein